MPEQHDHPSDKAALMARIHADHAQLDQTLDGLTEEQMLKPGPEGWSVKDHLAHLTTWERVLLHAHLGGRSFAEATGMDAATAEATATMTAETGLNDYFHRRDRDRELAEVLVDFRRTHSELIAKLEATDYGELLQPRHPDQPGSSRLIDYVAGDTYEHYREHAQLIAEITK